VNEKQLGGLLFVAGIALLLLFFLLAPRSPIRSYLTNYIGADSVDALMIYSGVLSIVLLVPGYIILESTSKPGYLVTMYIVAWLVSVLLVNTVNYFINIGSPALIGVSLALTFTLTFLALYKLVLRQLGTSYRVFIKDVMKKYYRLNENGELVEVNREELPSELVEKLDSLQNALIKETWKLSLKTRPETRIQWHNLLVLLTLLFLILYALIISQL